MMVAPPHGVLPIGNVVTMLSFPMLWGFHFRGLTTDAALRYVFLELSWIPFWEKGAGWWRARKGPPPSRSYLWQHPFFLGLLRSFRGLI